MKLRGIECWISVDGNRLEEHSVEVDEEKAEHSAWIASEPGQFFSINWRDPDQSRATNGMLQTDGIDCGGTLLEVPRFAGIQEIHKTHVLTSKDEGRALQFATLELTDDDRHLKQDTKDLGQIQLVMWHVRVKAAMPFGVLKIAEPSRVHEKTKKGLQLAVKLGAAEKMHSRSRKKFSVDNLEKLGTFIFRYRTLDMLRANGIAPAPLSASPVPAARPGPSKASSSSASPTASASRKRKRRESTLVTPEPQDVKPDIDLVELEEAEEQLRLKEEEYRRAKQNVEQRRRNKKVKIEEITGIISGEVIDLSELD
ncbi:hypothetical protein BD626DRAFT_430349 [Schizophyllum amplum]|uniref:DUF7918 domain-containing protein n=1 Tax=Schizophyllum amplum TaxID=97359 RepID=A0A550CI96_9AGAR|nr:hypothetical protein BD626DRAFT_430349 [Auriculariopsis ampla]